MTVVETSSLVTTPSRRVESDVSVSPGSVPGRTVRSASQQVRRAPPSEGERAQLPGDRRREHVVSTTRPKIGRSGRARERAVPATRATSPIAESHGSDTGRDRPGPSKASIRPRSGSAGAGTTRSPRPASCANERKTGGCEQILERGTVDRRDQRLPICRLPARGSGPPARPRRAIRSAAPGRVRPTPSRERDELTLAPDLGAERPRASPRSPRTRGRRAACRRSRSRPPRTSAAITMAAPGTDVQRADRRRRQPRDPADHRVMALGADVGAHPQELADVEEPALEHVLGDDGGARRPWRASRAGSAGSRSRCPDTGGSRSRPLAHGRAVGCGGPRR